MAVLSFDVLVKTEPASFKASCYKKSPTQRNGEQFTIGVLKSARLLLLALRFV
ncbi:hypothetical protein HMPREF9554_03107 [Treponema phagedenis F0421]|nr:hypothetical protein HMPREF9554_03107 [Treponema phagedenis F0421]